MIMTDSDVQDGRVGDNSGGASIYITIMMKVMSVIETDSRRLQR